MELMEGVALTESAVCIGLGVQRIDAHIELSSFLGVGEHLLGRGHIDELLFGHFLLISLIRIRMPFLRGFSVRFDDFLFRRRSFHVEDFVIISAFGLLL